MVQWVVPPADPSAAGYVISTDRERLDLDRVCDWLATAYWARHRDRAGVERSIANSRPYGLYDPAGTQIGFARVTTDLVSFAWLGDVIIAETKRGRGLGSWLVASVLDDLRAHGVPRFLLATRDAHGVYARLGFHALDVPEIWMEIDERPHRPKLGEVIGRRDLE